MSKLAAHVVLAAVAVAIVVCATVLLATGHSVPVELWAALTVTLGALAGVSVPSSTSGGTLAIPSEITSLVSRLETVAKGLFTSGSAAGAAAPPPASSATQAPTPPPASSATQAAT